MSKNLVIKTENNVPEHHHWRDRFEFSHAGEIPNIKLITHAKL